MTTEFEVIAIDRSTGKDRTVLVEARIRGHEPTIIIIDEVSMLHEDQLEWIMREYGPKERKPAQLPNRDWVARNQAPRSPRK